MTTFALTASAAPVADFVESSDIEQLQNQLNVALSRLTDQALLVTVLTLCGAGDGSSFGILVEAAAEEDIISGIGIDPATLSPSLYVASSPGALLKERASAVAAPPAGFPNVADVQIDGATKGKRFAGMALFATNAVDPFGAKFDLNITGNVLTDTTFSAVDVESTVSCAGPSSISYEGNGGFAVSNAPEMSADLDTESPVRKCAVFGQISVKASSTVPLALELRITKYDGVDYTPLSGVEPQTLWLASATDYANMSVAGVGDVSPKDVVELRVTNKTNSETVSVHSAQLLIKER